jgi:hypothetical protein
MFYAVEVCLVGSDLIASMSQMRTWLDHHRFQPDTFRQSSGGAGLTLQLDFKSETEAVAFAKAFGGRLLGMQAENGGAAPWSVAEDGAA